VSRRKGKKHEHVNHERWLVSYADFITLLFAFFVVMFAVSQVDSKKLGRFVESVSYAFQIKGVFPENQGSPLARGGSAGNSIIPLVVAERPTFLPHRAPSRQANAALISLETKLEAAGLADAVRVRHDPRGVAIALPEKDFFYAGTATLRPEAVDQLRAVAEVLSAESGAVQIEAHTDSLRSPRRPRAWRASSRRKRASRPGASRRRAWPSTTRWSRTRTGRAPT
jgi:chemotaxis protein MotB